MSFLWRDIAPFVTPGASGRPARRFAPALQTSDSLAAALDRIERLKAMLANAQPVDAAPPEAAAVPGGEPGDP